MRASRNLSSLIKHKKGQSNGLFDPLPLDKITDRASELLAFFSPWWRGRRWLKTSAQTNRQRLVASPSFRVNCNEGVENMEGRWEVRGAKLFLLCLTLPHFETSIRPPHLIWSELSIEGFFIFRYHCFRLVQLHGFRVDLKFSSVDSLVLYHWSSEIFFHQLTLGFNNLEYLRYQIPNSYCNFFCSQTVLLFWNSHRWRG